MSSLITVYAENSLIHNVSLAFRGNENGIHIFSLPGGNLEYSMKKLAIPHVHCKGPFFIFHHI